MQVNIENDKERKKEYLKSYGDAERAEKAIEDEIRQLRQERMCPSFVIDDMPHGSGMYGDLSDYVAEVDELLGELRKSMEARIKLRREIIRKIESMPKETEKLVLRLRYIQMMKWEDIALRTSYSWKQIHRIHGSALEHFSMT